MSYKEIPKSFLDDLFSDELFQMTEENNTASTSTKHLRTPSTRPNAVISVQDLESLKDSRVPINTQRKVNWVVKMFIKWLESWKVRLDNILKVYKDLDEMTVGDLNYCLQFFIAEIRKENGDLFPPSTYKEIISAFQHYLNNFLNINCSIFTDKEFLDTRKVLDAQMKRSASLGNVLPKKRSHSIAFEEEALLWENGSFGTSNGRQLLQTLIFHLGLHLSLRAAQEHRDLLYGPDSQLQLVTSPEGVTYLKYTERTSKNKKFGLKDARKEPKVTCIYPNTENPQRCVVALYEKYVQHRPKNAIPAFYLTPKQNNSGSCEVWYKNMAFGVHSIEKTTKCLMATINKDTEKKFTNTSLRRTAQMRLLQAGIPTEVCQKKTGRISLAANQSYIESDQFEAQMSTTLYGESSMISNKTKKTLNTSDDTDNAFNNIFGDNSTFKNCSFNFYGRGSLN